MADIEGAVLEELQADAVEADASNECKSGQYTAYLIEGSFADLDEPGVGFVRLDAVRFDELMCLMALALRNDYDMVIRRYEGVSGNEQE